MIARNAVKKPGSYEAGLLIYRWDPGSFSL
jgi:hypothetical protein